MDATIAEAAPPVPPETHVWMESLHQVRKIPPDTYQAMNMAAGPVTLSVSASTLLCP